jgi:hypothetical protein
MPWARISGSIQQHCVQEGIIPDHSSANCSRNKSLAPNTYQMLGLLTRLLLPLIAGIHADLPWGRPFFLSDIFEAHNASDIGVRACGYAVRATNVVHCFCLASVLNRGDKPH